jgi:uncharacterized membrane-anchored protein YhcB (DUF1043 family)
MCVSILHVVIALLVILFQGMACIRVCLHESHPMQQSAELRLCILDLEDGLDQLESEQQLHKEHTCKIAELVNEVTAMATKAVQALIDVPEASGWFPTLPRIAC